MGAYLEMYDILKFMIICISIGSVVILGISYSSLKSRSKDLTLLRGIGATKKQLFFMITLEGFIIYIVSQFIAILLSVGICYLIMNVFYSSSYYQSIIYNDAIIICSIFSLILIFVSFLLPLLSTLKNALTGTFDHPQFQYFQVRYKKLKKQNTAQIAYRSLMTKKRFTFILILTLTCTIHYLSSWYYAITVETKERDNILEVMPSLYRTITIYGIDEKIPLELIQNMRTYSQNIQAFPLQSLSTEDCNNNLGSNDYITNNYYLSVITPDYLKTIKNIEFDGRFPEKDDEVFITDLSYYQNVDNGNILSETLTYKMGDTVKIKGKTMKIVGYIKPQEISFTRDNQNYNYEDCYFNQYTLYVTKQAYHDLSGKSPDQVEYIKAFYDDSNYNELSSVIEKYKNKNLIINDSAESIDYLTKIVTKNFDQYIEELSIMSLSIVCGAIIIYAFMNKYDIQNNKKEYMLLKIIGTTKKEFYKIQLKKALMMTSVSMILNLMTLYLQYGFSINLVLYSFIFFIIILTIIFILYVIPIHSLLKQDPIEVMGIEE